MKTPNAIELLEEQHEEVKQLLEDITSTTPRAERTRHRLLPEIDKKIRAHSRIEEEIFYPAFREAASQKEEKLYYEALEEHRAALHELQEVCSEEVSGAVFAAKVKVLKDMLEHHIEEEEELLFPRMREIFTEEQLSALGETMLARFEQLTAEEEAGEPTEEGIQPAAF